MRWLGQRVIRRGPGIFSVLARQAFAHAFASSDQLLGANRWSESLHGILDMRSIGRGLDPWGLPGTLLSCLSVTSMLVGVKAQNSTHLGIRPRQKAVAQKVGMLLPRFAFALPCRQST